MPGSVIRLDTIYCVLVVESHSNRLLVVGILEVAQHLPLGCRRRRHELRETTNTYFDSHTSSSHSSRTWTALALIAIVPSQARSARLRRHIEPPAIPAISGQRSRSAT